MTARSSIATIFLTMALVSLASAITALINRQNLVPYPIWFLTSFFILLRIKMYLDDLKDFKTDLKLKWSMIIGIVSWFFWVLSAANIASIEQSSKYLAVAISFATIALLSTAIVNGFKKKHIGWFLLNAAYIGLLLILYFQPGICLVWTTVILLICIALTVFDFWFSESMAIIDDLNKTNDR
ncbi:MAG: hypothetical protein ACKVE4_08990 [Dissulfuribacterales bacterium]